MKNRTLNELNKEIGTWERDREVKAVNNMVKAAHLALAGFRIDLTDYSELEDHECDDAVTMCEAFYLTCQEANKSGHQ